MFLDQINTTVYVKKYDILLIDYHQELHEILLVTLYIYITRSNEENGNCFNSNELSFIYSGMPCVALL